MLIVMFAVGYDPFLSASSDSLATTAFLSSYKATCHPMYPGNIPVLRWYILLTKEKNKSQLKTGTRVLFETLVPIFIKIQPESKTYTAPFQPRY